MVIRKNRLLPEGHLAILLDHLHDGQVQDVGESLYSMAMTASTHLPVCAEEREREEEPARAEGGRPSNLPQYIGSDRTGQWMGHRVWERLSKQGRRWEEEGGGKSCSR